MAGANLAGLVDGPARWGPGRPAVLVGTRPVRTWAALAEAVARRAGGLRAHLDVAPGERVALWAANGPAYLEALLAIWHAGAVAVPLHARLHPREVAGLLQRSAARACFVDEDGAAELAALAPRVALVVLGGEGDRRLAGGEPVDPRPRAAGDDAWIFFTSGTTGLPKGARLTHGNLLAMAGAFWADVAPVGPQDLLVHAAALSHASGLFALPFLARGAAQVLPESGGFEPGELLGLVRALPGRATFFVPPTGLRRLVADPAAGAVEPGRLGTILVGAAPVRPADLRDAVAAFGPVVWNGYGQGESPCTITALDRATLAAAVRDGDAAALRSVGVARALTRVRVVGDDGRELPAGAAGEVVVDGPTVMTGYLDAPGETAQALRGGWLHTGDVGRLDADGRLTLTDRVKDLIITGGLNVAPREVEEVLDADPAVADVAVVGLPDPEWGERVAAFVVPAVGATVDEAALDRRCLQAIARHKRPREYHVVGELPRNPAGKVVKARLREVAGAAR